MTPFKLLADPTTYEPCPWNMTADVTGRLHLVAFFKRHVETVLKLGIAARTLRGQAEADVLRDADLLRVRFHARFDAYRDDAESFGPITILDIAGWRDALLRDTGFVDAFIDVKIRENQKMLPLLPSVCAQLDSLEGAAKIQTAIEGVFAGNIFDMGAEATAKAFVGQSPDFFTTRATLTPRPWLIDQLDAFSKHLLDLGRYRKAIFFVDNAGSDFLLGAVPMIRLLAQTGTRVIIAANERPTLNDMTAAETRAIWPAVVAAIPDLRDLPIEIVSTGTGEPLIDLRRVSDELNSAASGVDLVILEGMGRGVESNLNAMFKCDALNLAMIKEQLIADHVGGKVFDVVCRFREGV